MQHLWLTNLFFDTLLANFDNSTFVYLNMRCLDCTLPQAKVHAGLGNGHVYSSSSCDHVFSIHGFGIRLKQHCFKGRMIVPYLIEKIHSHKNASTDYTS